MSDIPDKTANNPDSATPATPPVVDNHEKRISNLDYFNSNVAGKLDFSKRTIDGLLNSTIIQPLIAVYGYSMERILAMQVAYLDALAANSNQQKEHGDKAGAYAEFEKLFSVAKEEFDIISKLAKLALKNNVQKLDQLGLLLKKKRSIAGIFNSMQKFYDNTVSDRVVLTALAVYNFDDSKINKFRDNFIQARDAHNLYYKENSEAVEATRIRDEKIEILDNWMQDFFTVAKIALAKNPELMMQISVS